MNFIQNIKNRVVQTRDFLINLLFPIECLVCGQEKKWLCEKCFKNLEYNYKQYCLNCKTANNFGEICSYCKEFFSIDGILIAGNYKDKNLSNLIKKFKYYFIKDLATDLAKFLEKFLHNTVMSADSPLPLKNIANTIIIPVPLHKKRLNWRGFNQSEEIAKILTQDLNAKLSTDLKRIKHKKPQMKLSAAQRKKNIANCFVWTGKDLEKNNILLVDDVTTTGSTLNECARVLKQNNAGKIWGLVIANG